MHEISWNAVFGIVWLTHHMEHSNQSYSFKTYTQILPSGLFLDLISKGNFWYLTCQRVTFDILIHHVEISKGHLEHICTLQVEFTINHVVYHPSPICFFHPPLLRICWWDRHQLHRPAGCMGNWWYNILWSYVSTIFHQYHSLSLLSHRTHTNAAKRCSTWNPNNLGCAIIANCFTFPTLDVAPNSETVAL